MVLKVEKKRNEVRRGRAPLYHPALPYVFILPFFILFTIFMLYPILETFVLSFQHWRPSQATFVGLKNYRYILTSRSFWLSLGNDALVLFVQVPIMLFLALLLAVSLHAKRLRGKGMFRLLIFLPVLMDMVTYSIAFQMLFNTHAGMVNFLLHSVGLPKIHWTSVPWAARLAISLMVTWRWTGYNAIILLSGLQSVSNDVYEAALVDGASALRTFFQITIPMLKPILLFCMVLSTVGTLQLFTEPFILTGGGPQGATETPMLYLYQVAFQSFHFGLASAGTYVITSIIGVLSYLQIRITDGGRN